MTDPDILDQIIALIKRAAEQEVAVAMELADGEYRRGIADGRAAQKRETLDFLSDSSAITPRLQMPDPARMIAERNSVVPEGPNPWEQVTHHVRPASERKRAPKGMVRSLVVKVLGKVTNGLTPQGILDHAETDLERMVKPASIRGELREGFGDGRYRESRGQWFLIKNDGDSVETGGASSRTDPPLLEL